MLEGFSAARCTHRVPRYPLRVHARAGRETQTPHRGGSAHLKPYTESILTELARYLNTVPNRLCLPGHTDAAPYAGASGRTNWDLSSDRANAARRALEAAGLSTDKTARVVGLSSSVLFDRSDARNPINRRISIIVMTRQAERDALKTDTPASIGAGDTGAEP